MARPRPHALSAALLADLHSPDAIIRCGAAEKIRMRPDPGAVADLTDALRAAHPRDFGFRAAVARALAAIDHPAARDAVADHAGDGEARVAAEGTRAARRGSPSEVQARIERFLTRLRDPDPKQRAAACRALGDSGADDAVAALVVALRDPDRVVRAEAAPALGQTGSAAAVEPLRQALGDRSPDVRAAAAAALGKLGIEPARVALEEAARHSDPGVRLNAVAALPPDSPVLKAALKDTRSDVRWMAAASMGAGAPGSIEPLRAALRDRSAGVRAEAARKLSASPEALGELLDACRDRQPLVRKAAAESVGALARRAAADVRRRIALALARCLDDADEDVRRAAIAGLGRSASTAAATALLGQLKDPVVAEDALNSLEAVLGRQAHDLPEDLLGRCAALRAVTRDVWHWEPKDDLRDHIGTRKVDARPVARAAERELSRRRR